MSVTFELNPEEETTVEQPTVEQDAAVKNDEPPPAAATETKKKARSKKAAVGKLASSMLGKPLKLFSSNASKGSAASVTPKTQALPPAVAFDIEVQKRAGAVAPPSLLERIMQRGTSLAASADARHLGAATRRAEAAAEVKRRLADNAVRRQAAAARRAAAPPQEVPQEAETEAEAQEEAKPVPPLTDKAATRNSRSVFSGFAALLSPRKTKEAPKEPVADVTPPSAFDVELDKRGTEAPTALVARLAVRGSALADSAATRHAAAATRRAVDADAAKGKLAAAAAKAAAAASRRAEAGERVVALRASLEASYAAATARVAAMRAARVAKAAEMNGRVAAAAERRLINLVSGVVAATIQQALDDAYPVAPAAEPAAPTTKAKAPRAFGRRFKLPGLFGGKPIAAAA